MIGKFVEIEFTTLMLVVSCTVYRIQYYLDSIFRLERFFPTHHRFQVVKPTQRVQFKQSGGSFFIIEILKAILNERWVRKAHESVWNERLMGKKRTA